MAINPIIAYLWSDLIPEYSEGLEYSVVYTLHSFFVKSLHGRVNRSLPCLQLHTHAGKINPTFLTSNIYIGLCLPRAHTLTRLQMYEMFEVLLLIRIKQRVRSRWILNFDLLRDTFQYHVARGIPHKEGVLYPPQSMVRTPPPPLCWTILKLQISLNAWHPACPLHCEGQ